MFPGHSCAQREPKRGAERNYTSSGARCTPTRYLSEPFGDYYARLRSFFGKGRVSLRVAFASAIVHINTQKTYSFLSQSPRYHLHSSLCKVLISLRSYHLLFVVSEQRTKTDTCSSWRIERASENGPNRRRGTRSHPV